MSRAVIFLISLLSAAPSSFAGDGAPTLESLGICADKIQAIRGSFGDVCRELLNSPELRVACAKVSDEDRIKCDGSEPVSVMTPRFGTVKACTEGLYGGAKSMWKLVGGVALSTIAMTSTPAHGNEELAKFLNEASSQDFSTSTAGSYALNFKLDKKAPPKDEGTIRLILKHYRDPNFWSELSSSIVSDAKDGYEAVNEFDRSLKCLNPDALDRFSCDVIGQMFFLAPAKAVRFGFAGTAAWKAWLGANTARMTKAVETYGELPAAAGSFGP